MNSRHIIGVLALQGDVIEHFNALKKAIQTGGFNCEVILARTPAELSKVDGLIIPGGESTVLYGLTERVGLFEAIKKVNYIFGTCAGAIMLAKNVLDKADNQKTLELMDITVQRNGYGRQNESFSQELTTSLGNLRAVFIRAPKIIAVASDVNILAKNNDEIIACEQTTNGQYFLAASFHPELTSTIFHKYFVKKVCG